MTEILILGIGNLLLSDEAVGVRVVEQLERDYTFPAGVELLDGGTAGMELMADLACREHLIIVDAVLSGHEPGTVITLEDDQVPTLFSRKISPHQLGISDVLSALRLTDEFPQRLTLVGIEPLSVIPHIGLTPLITAVIPEVLTRIIQILQATGCYPQPKGKVHVH